MMAGQILIDRLGKTILMLLSLFGFTACSTIAVMFGKGDPPPRSERLGEEIVVVNPTTSYEWAVQSHEAGLHADAKSKFEELEKDAAGSRNFFLIPYYLGKNYYFLGEYQDAIQHLEDYLRRIPSSENDQEARMTLLAAYVAERKWEKAAVLAAESNNKSLYTGNRILMQLLWSEALIHRNEIIGAEKVLYDAKKTLSQIPKDSDIGQGTAGLNEKLNERALWLETAIASARCKALPLLRRPQKSLRKSAMASWYTRKIRCAYDMITAALPNYGDLGPRWNQEVTQTLLEALEEVALAPDLLVQEERIPNLTMAREGAIAPYRKHFYRLLNLFRDLSDNVLGTLERKQAQQRLTAKVEQILQKIAIESSKADRTL